MKAHFEIESLRDDELINLSLDAVGRKLSEITLKFLNSCLPYPGQPPDLEDTIVFIQGIGYIQQIQRKHFQPKVLNSKDHMMEIAREKGLFYITPAVWEHEKKHYDKAKSYGIDASIIMLHTTLADEDYYYLCTEVETADLEKIARQDRIRFLEIWGELMVAPYKKEPDKTISPSDYDEYLFGKQFRNLAKGYRRYKDRSDITL